MLELYEQNKTSLSQGSEVEGNAVGGTRAVSKEPAVSEDWVSEQMPSCSAPQNSSVPEVPPTSTENHSNDGSTEMGSVITDHKLDVEVRDPHIADGLPQNDNERELTDETHTGAQQIDAGDQDRICDTNEAAEMQRRDGLELQKSGGIGRNLQYRDGPLGQSPKEAIKMIDKDKVKAALEKTRKARRENTLKKGGVMDEDDFIERELEDGLELAVEDEKNKWEGRQYGTEFDIADCTRRENEQVEDGKHPAVKQQSPKEVKSNKVITDDSSNWMNKHKRKATDSPDMQPDGKKWCDQSYGDELVVDVNCRRPEEEGHC